MQVISKLNTLSKEFSDDVEEDDEDLENQEGPQKDNDNEMISVEYDIDKKLEEALKLFGQEMRSSM